MTKGQGLNRNSLRSLSKSVRLNLSLLYLVSSSQYLYCEIQAENGYKHYLQ